jgi:hypothetical protein
MAMRKRALLWLTGLALVALALLLTDWLLWAPGLTEDNVRRIRAGLTLAEVEELLGSPAADTFDLGVEIAPDEQRGYRWQREWREGGGDVVVQFTADGRVVAAAGQGGVTAWPPRPPACLAGLVARGTTPRKVRKRPPLGHCGWEASGDVSVANSLNSGTYFGTLQERAGTTVTPIILRNSSTNARDSLCWVPLMSSR